MGGVSSFFQRLLEDAARRDAVSIGNRKFAIELKIGQGAFGSLFILEEQVTERRYAVKVAHKAELLKNQSVLAQFFIERDALRSLYHPCLSNLLAADQDAYRLFLVSPLSLGGDLSTKLLRYKRLPERAVTFVALPLLLALRHLHEQNITHGDVKPSNVLVHKDGYCTLCDLGLASLGSSPPRRWGTTAYMAPEVLHRGSLAPPADIWSLGVTLFEAFWGLLPWQISGMYTPEAPVARQKSDRDQKRLETEAQIKLVDGLNAPDPHHPEIHFIWGMHDVEPTDKFTSLVAGMTAAAPQQRLTAAQALEHPFFDGIDVAAYLNHSLTMSSFLRTRTDEYPFPLQFNIETEERVVPSRDAISISDQRRFFDHWNWVRQMPLGDPDQFSLGDVLELHASPLFLNQDIDLLACSRENVEEQHGPASSSSPVLPPRDDDEDDLIEQV